MRVSAEERARVCDAIRAAEQISSAEFVCVLVRRASDDLSYSLAGATLLALATPWPLLFLTAWPVQTILLAQLAVFAAALWILLLAPVRQSIMPRQPQRAAAHRAAAEQFLIRGLAHTPHRRGILLFVAVDERYARVLADDGAASLVKPEDWRAAVEHLTREARAGRYADGFVRALQHCAALLPKTDGDARPGANALPDRFYVLD